MSINRSEIQCPICPYEAAYHPILETIYEEDETEIETLSIETHSVVDTEEEEEAEVEMAVRSLRKLVKNEMIASKISEQPKIPHWSRKWGFFRKYGTENHTKKITQF